MRLLTTTAVLALLAVPAFAGGSHECQGGHNCNTGTPAPSSMNVNANLNYNRASSTAAAHAAAASRSSATGGSARATGGASSATTGPVTVTNSYTGGATDPAAGYSGGGTTNIDARSAPSVLVPPIGGGGADCPVVGFGVGGSGLAGGGGFGPSWISTRCDHRRYAMVIYELTGDRQAALDYLASVEPDVRHWLEARERAPVAQAAPVALAVTNVATVPAPAWCKRARPTTDASRAYVASVCGGR